MEVDSVALTSDAAIGIRVGGIPTVEKSLLPVLSNSPTTFPQYCTQIPLEQACCAGQTLPLVPHYKKLSCERKSKRY